MNALLVTRPALGLTLLRLTLGGVFFMHGYVKVFSWGIAGVTSGFREMGVPFPGLAGPVVSMIELVGGILVILGVYPRLIGVLFAGVVTGAIIFAKAGNGFFAPKGFELELTLALASLSMAIAGAGSWSMMDLYGKFKKKS